MCFCLPAHWEELIPQFHTKIGDQYLWVVPLSDFNMGLLPLRPGEWDTIEIISSLSKVTYQEHLAQCEPPNMQY